MKRKNGIQVIYLIIPGTYFLCIPFVIELIEIPFLRHLRVYVMNYNMLVIL